jgi:uncharacterized membrane protein YbaN (DUF454 family)
MIKILLIFLGTVSLSLGIIGIAVPGLPTTPFLLLAATLYFRSSKRLYRWLLDTKYFGPYIRKYRENRAMDFKVKIYSIVLMWLMILSSVIFFIDNSIARIIVVSVGIIGTVVMSMIPTIKRK